MLYGFNCTDGGRPNAGLIAVGDTLYGATILGGNGRHCGHFGCGTVFAFNPSSGKKHIVYSFDGGADGNAPAASVIALRGTLYGTTEKGGRGSMRDAASYLRSILHRAKSGSSIALRGAKTAHCRLRA